MIPEPFVPAVNRFGRPLAGVLLGALLFSAGYFAGKRSSGGPASPGASSTQILTDLSLLPGKDGVFISDASRLARVPVISVVDGDTLHVLWEGADTRLRYYGVDTPEVGEACHDEASARNAALAGKEVLLAFDERARDNYGRILAYVFTPEGKSLDSALVAEGFGRAWTRDGRWRDGLEELERASRASKRGCLWSRPAKAVPARSPKARRGSRRPR